MNSQEPFVKLDQFDFHHRLAEVPGTAIVIFTGPACGSCRSWKELLVRFARSRGQPALFEVDIERDAALAAEFSVFHLPSLFLYYDGRYHSAIQCEAGLSALSGAVDQSLAAPAQEMP